MSRKKDCPKKRNRRQKKINQTNNESFKSFRDCFLPEGIFSQIPLHGNIKWTPICLVWLSVFWAWSDSRNVTAKYRKKKTKGMRRRNNEMNKPHPPKPQAWITLMWHMGLRLPWDWRLGPSNSSERDHVMEMVQAGAFPKNTLFCGDAGFVGYPLWSCLLSQGADFLVRVGGNVSLLRPTVHYQTEKFGKDIQVLCWPDEAMQKGQEPLHLRLLQVRLGKTKVWMLTSVLDRQKLTAKAVVRFYKMRWGIEVEFRGLKQTLDRAKLRCRNDQRLLVELDWSILAMAVAELFALQEQLSERRSKHRDKVCDPDPVKRSLAKTMRALRKCLRHLNEVPQVDQDLASQLREAITDNYQRRKAKQARYRPPNPDKKPLGNPKLRLLSEKAKKKLRLLNAKKAA
jgi:hypothetical protein